MSSRLERCVELLGACASTVLTRRLLAETTGGEVTPAQLDALLFVRRHQRCSAKDLSEGLRISIPSSTRLVDRLARKRLMDRCESGIDRRLVQLTVTAAGQRVLEAVHRARRAYLRRVVDGLRAEERDGLLGLLERFLRAAMEDVQVAEECCLHCGTEHDFTCVVNEAHVALAGRPVEHP